MVQNVGYEKHDALRFVLRHGKVGVKCFIILKGNVTVLEPSSELDINKKEDQFYIVKMSAMNDIQALFKKIKQTTRMLTEDQKEEYLNFNSDYLCLFEDLI